MPAPDAAPSADTADVRLDPVLVPVPDTTGVVRPGDVVQLAVYTDVGQTEKETTGEFPVDAEGVVVLPKIGPTEVGGLTPEEAEEKIVRELGEFVRTPAIDVTVLRSVKVLGAVTKPGLYPVDPTKSIRDALAIAGGVTPLGNDDAIRLVRDGRVVAEEVDLQATLMGSPVRSGDEIYVPEKSWFARNTGTVISGTVGLLSVLAAIIVR